MTIEQLKEAIRRTGEYARLVELWNEASKFVELFYLIHAVRNARDRTLWLVTLLCVPIFAVPAYWFLRFRKGAGSSGLPASPS